MPKLISSPQRIIRPPKGIVDDLRVLEQSTMDKGMDVSKAPTDIDKGALTDAKNVMVRYGITTVRAGNTIYTPLAPNTNGINYLAVFAQDNGQVNLLRFSGNDIRAATATTWAKLTSLAPINAGSQYFHSTVVNNQFFFTNDGLDPIQEVDMTTDSYAALGNAPKFKFVVGFGNRIVGANLVDSTNNPIHMAWSGQNNYPEWDPLVDISAGFTDLVSISSPEADPITGLFSTDNWMVIPRERSIWTAVNQPSATQPFYFAQRVPELGCDCPRTCVQVPGGIMFVSYRHESVFFYDASQGSMPARVGLPIERVLMPTIENVNYPFAAFDQKNNEYNLVVPRSDNTTVIWRYNFINSTWAYDEFELC